MLYTFITEKEGGTLLEQFRGKNVEDALLKWSHASESKPRFDKERLVDEDGPVQITGLKQAWCFTGVDKNDVSFLVHIIATKESA